MSRGWVMQLGGEPRGAAPAVAAWIHPRCRAEVVAARVRIRGWLVRAGGGGRPGLAGEEEETRLLSSLGPGWIERRHGEMNLRGWGGEVAGTTQWRELSTMAGIELTNENHHGT